MAMGHTDVEKFPLLQFKAVSVIKLWSKISSLVPKERNKQMNKQSKKENGRNLLIQILLNLNLFDFYLFLAIFHFPLFTLIFKLVPIKWIIGLQILICLSKCK